MNWYKNFLLPVGLLSGTIIGAGVFALPSVFVRSGVVVGFSALLLVTGLSILLHLLYADIILRTSGEHRFVGYARMYLGNTASWFSVVMTILEMIFVMTIYLVLSVSFINLIIAGPLIVKLLLFWAISSFAIFFSLRRLAFSEFLVTVAIIAIIGAIFFLGIQGGSYDKNFPPFTGFSTILLPLGAIFFALSGRVAIPSLVSYFRGGDSGHHSLKRAIIFGTVLPAIVYALFVVGILSLSPIVSDDAVSGLRGVVSPIMLLMMGVLGLLSLWSSYVVVGIDVGNILRYDLKFPFLLRIVAVVGGPLILYFIGFQSFIPLVSFVGGIFLGLESIFIVLMWAKARKHHIETPSLLKKVPLFLIGVTLLISLIVILHEVYQYVMNG